MAKIPLIVPPKSSSNMVVLGRRENVLQWFTQKGWDLIPDNIEFDRSGKRIRVPKGGWKQVSPDDFEAPPSPLKAEEVVPPAGKKEVPTTTGADVTDTPPAGDKLEEKPAAETKEAPPAGDKPADKKAAQEKATK